MARNSRLFLGRAVRYVAERGITQFVDLSCGLPPPPHVHDMARAVHPGAAVAYVDNDPAVTTEADVLLDAGAGRGIAVVRADLRDPPAVLSDVYLGEVIDIGEPVCVIAAMVLHHLAPGQARAVVAEYTRMIVPGSYLVLSTPRVDDAALWERVAEAYTPAVLYNFTDAEFTSFFADLEMIRPGVRPVVGFRPGWADALQAPDRTYVLGGIGRKPLRGERDDHAQGAALRVHQHPRRSHQRVIERPDGIAREAIPLVTYWHRPVLGRFTGPGDRGRVEAECAEQIRPRDAVLLAVPLDRTREGAAGGHLMGSALADAERPRGPHTEAHGQREQLVNLHCWRRHRSRTSLQTGYDAGSAPDFVASAVTSLRRFADYVHLVGVRRVH